MFCGVCHKWFPAKIENHYIAIDAPPGFKALTEPSRQFDAIDCPHCGRQKLLGIRLPAFPKPEIKEEVEEDDD